MRLTVLQLQSGEERLRQPSHELLHLVCSEQASDCAGFWLRTAAAHQPSGVKGGSFIASDGGLACCQPSPRLIGQLLQPSAAAPWSLMHSLSTNVAAALG